MVHLVAEQPQRVERVEGAVQEGRTERGQRIRQQDAAGQTQAGAVDQVVLRHRRRQQQRQERRDQPGHDQATEPDHVPEPDRRVVAAGKQFFADEEENERNRDQQTENVFGFHAEERSPSAPARQAPRARGPEIVSFVIMIAWFDACS
jgi:hypothetical protein